MWMDIVSILSVVLLVSSFPENRSTESVSTRARREATTEVPNGSSTTTPLENPIQQQGVNLKRNAELTTADPAEVEKRNVESSTLVDSSTSIGNPQKREVVEAVKAFSTEAPIKREDDDSSLSSTDHGVDMTQRNKRDVQQPIGTQGVNGQPNQFDQSGTGPTGLVPFGQPSPYGQQGQPGQPGQFGQMAQPGIAPMPPQDQQQH